MIPASRVRASTDIAILASEFAIGCDMTQFRLVGRYLISENSVNMLICRDSEVDIATRYGLDGPGIESRWRRDFPHPSRLAPGPTQPPVQWVPGHFPGG